MESPEEKRTNRNHSRFSAVLMVILIIIIGSLLGVLSTGMINAWLSGTYLLTDYDFRTGVLPSGVTTSASLYEEDGHHSLQCDELGETIHLQEFESYYQLKVEIYFTGLTLQASQALLPDQPVFTLTTHDLNRQCDLAEIDAVYLDEPTIVLFPKNYTRKLNIVFTNFASMSEAPEYAYSLLVSRIIVYEFVP